MTYRIRHIKEINTNREYYLAEFKDGIFSGWKAVSGHYVLHASGFDWKSPDEHENFHDAVEAVKNHAVGLIKGTVEYCEVAKI